ncbi:MAG: hypothetical protein ACKPKO_16710, partial [Candidatus Fonsibacter sp.]
HSSPDAAPPSAEARRGCINCFRDATRCAASVANLRHTTHTRLKVAVSGRALDQQLTIAFIQPYTDARCPAQL